MAVSISDLRQGACYSNGEFGHKWSVWQVVEIVLDKEGDRTQAHIRYRIMAGRNRRKYMTMSCEDFACRVRYEVVLVESTWQRIE